MKAPKILINTNYTITAMSRLDRRRLHFAPVSQYYGVLGDSGKSIADVHGGWLLEDNWSKEDWIAFYVTCVQCLHQYLEKGLFRFDDEVLADRQLISAAGGNEDLLNTLKTFIKEVVASGGECTKQQVLDTNLCSSSLDQR
ncbi:hypothetical protein [Prochlorococcus marinus]|uniref:Uncharacterized protein n=1 Tax=Prochlorococcus marinus (strain MIT 9303) TaxID=59922 RepID=A2CDJ0_PROM3|nr:hypothetical protein [Prochlorococcus marinus]ABM79550.1 Hypothetical protein P9303_28201 [Prochlorococcus marinus str. MIT 9303]